MISGPRLIFDFISRVVSCSGSIIAPASGDLFVFLTMTGLNDDGSPSTPSPTLAALSLVLKEFTSGDVVALSDGWQLVSGSSPSQWVMHLPMTGDVLAAALKGLVQKTGIDPKIVQDIVVGNVLPASGGASLARMAMFHAG